jgi:hypothetical protein
MDAKAKSSLDVDQPNTRMVKNGPDRCAKEKIGAVGAGSRKDHEVRIGARALEHYADDTARSEARGRKP